ncbi:MAG: hypothetical protein GY852_02020 [bacterium]|nr:hypothetical protein [bacterium]
MRGVLYDKELHLKKCISIWMDAGWLDKGQEKLAENWFNSADALVGEHNNETVALALSHRGSYYHKLHHEELPFCAVTGITVAFHGRKLGFAGSLTAELLARGAERGEIVAGLGMFEQGFYNKVGFGNYPYMKLVYFRPADLVVSGSFSSIPKRFSNMDWEKIHKNRAERLRCHGSVNLPPIITHAEMEINKNSFTIGFVNKQNDLTHHYVVASVKGEHGPMRIAWTSFRTAEQFRDILLSIKSFGDQIDLVSMQEPSGIQFQSLLKKPISIQRQSAASTGMKAGIRAGSWTQCRILDLEKSVNGMKCMGDSCDFNLILKDPVGKYLDSSFKWKGCSGNYTVQFSDSSKAAVGLSDGLPLMKCSVETFSKLWAGTAKPTMLAYTDAIEAPVSLLTKLDSALRLPEPNFDWDL